MGIWDAIDNLMSHSLQKPLPDGKPKKQRVRKVVWVDFSRQDVGILKMRTTPPAEKDAWRFTRLDELTPEERRDIFPGEPDV